MTEYRSNFEVRPNFGDPNCHVCSGMIQNPIFPWFMTFYVISFCDILCHMPYHDGDMGIKSYTTLKEKNHHRLEKIFQKAI